MGECFDIATQTVGNRCEQGWGDNTEGIPKGNGTDEDLFRVSEATSMSLTLTSMSHFTFNLFIPYLTIAQWWQYFPGNCILTLSELPLAGREMTHGSLQKGAIQMCMCLLLYSLVFIC